MSTTGGETPSGTFIDVSSGEHFACGVQTGGAARCWGPNDYAGHTPTPSGPFTAIAAGTEHTCGLRPDGTIECWGATNDDRLVVPAING